MTAITAILLALICVVGEALGMDVGRFIGIAACAWFCLYLMEKG